VKDLSRGKTVTVFTDGDRAGELILREMLQTMDIDFVARAPRGSEVEELTQKQLVKCLRNKIPINQFLEMSGFESTGATRQPMEERGEGGRENRGDNRDNRNERRDDRPPRRDSDNERPMPPPPPRDAPPMRAPPPPPPPPAALSPELQKYFQILGGIENTSKSVFLGPDDAVVGEVPVKEMIDALASLGQPAKTVVFDGVVSQRLLDVAQEKGIATVVANRVGAVGKIPEGIRVVTRMDSGAPPPSR
ncbi:MAG: DNA primase, partial [Thermoplasmata archaeon]|nr:DNA primase [Thermoplasmata archaeon]